jgi:hypothetical protein
MFQEWSTFQTGFNIRTEAGGGEADYPIQPVLVEHPQRTSGQRSQTSRAVAVPKTVLRPNVCQVTCRVKQEHMSANCPKY